MMPLKMGVSFLPDATPDVKTADSYFADALALADIADQAGLEFVKITEHYLKVYGGYCPSPLAFLAAVAARTKKVRLMTGGVVPVFHHPIQLAAEAAMVDAISGGRLDLGFARGYMPYEFSALGVPLDESRSRFTAVIETVVRLWTEASVTVDTPYFQFENATLMPRPVQQPHPPVWVAAVTTPESFVWIGEKGFNLMITTLGVSCEQTRAMIKLYQDAYHQHHGDANGGGQIVLSLPLYIADTDARAVEEGEHFLQRYLNVWSDAAGSWNTVRAKDYRRYTGLGHALQRITPASIRQRGGAIMGSPECVADRIRWLQEEVPADAMIWQVDFGAMPGDLARQNLTRLVDNVIPHL